MTTSHYDDGEEEVDQARGREIYYEAHKAALLILDNVMRDLGFQVDEYEDEQPITKPVTLTVEQHQRMMDALGEFLSVCVYNAISGSSDHRMVMFWEAEARQNGHNLD